jgi:hypothetical protein
MQISQKKINLGESCFKMKSINRKDRKVAIAIRNTHRAQRAEK